MHALVGAARDEEELVVVVLLDVELAWVAVAVGHRLHVDVGRGSVVLERDGAAHPLVLVDIGEHRDEGLDGLQGRATVGIDIQGVVGVEAVELERGVVTLVARHGRGCRSRGTRRGHGDHGKKREGESCGEAGGLHVPKLPCGPN